MNRSVSFHEAAENELNDAADFYDLESTGIGSTFLDDVQKAVKSIIAFPEAAPLLQGRVRKKIVQKFPYSVVYSLRETEIRILAVAHQRRRPFYWSGRH